MYSYIHITRTLTFLSIYIFNFLHLHLQLQLNVQVYSRVHLTFTFTFTCTDSLCGAYGVLFDHYLVYCRLQCRTTCLVHRSRVAWSPRFKIWRVSIVVSTVVVHGRSLCTSYLPVFAILVPYYTGDFVNTNRESTRGISGSSRFVTFCPPHVSHSYSVGSRHFASTNGNKAFKPGTLHTFDNGAPHNTAAVGSASVRALMACPTQSGLALARKLHPPCVEFPIRFPAPSSCQLCFGDACWEHRPSTRRTHRWCTFFARTTNRENLFKNVHPAAPVSRRALPASRPAGACLDCLSYLPMLSRRLWRPPVVRLPARPSTRTTLATTSRRVRLRVSERFCTRECCGASVVTLSVRISDLDLFPRGERRLEVVAGGLPLVHGAQLAIDTAQGWTGTSFSFRDREQRTAHITHSRLCSKSCGISVFHENPRLPSTPDSGHAARWWPKKSRLRQAREDRGKGSHKRQRNKQHKEELEQERKVREELPRHGSPDMDHDCGLRNRCSVGKRGQMALEEKRSSTARAAKNCQPWSNIPGSASSLPHPPLANTSRHSATPRRWTKSSGRQRAWCEQRALKHCQTRVS